MSKLVLLRHGESIWNLENRFTGWVDIGLSANGISEAKYAGKLLKDKGYGFDLAFTSLLSRAQRTLDLCLSEMSNNKLKIVKDWRLNERHYGSLQGLNKDDMVKSLEKNKFYTGGEAMILLHQNLKRAMKITLKMIQNIHI